MSLVLSLLVLTSHAGLLSEETPRSARLVEDGRILLAQDTPPPLVPTPQEGYSTPYQAAPAPGPQRGALLAERERLVESMPTLALPIVLLAVGAGLLISSYPLALFAFSGGIPFAFIALGALIAGVVLVSVGTPMLIVRIINRAKTQRRINAIDRDLQRAAEVPGRETQAEWLPVATVAF